MRVRRLACLLLVLSACTDVRSSEQLAPAMLVVDGDTVVLQAGARIADVSVSAGTTEFTPASVDLHPGDVLRITASDRGPHAIVFDDAATDSAGVAFLAASGQSRGLPLLAEGAAWVVSFDGAPPGFYAARCLTHGETLPIRVIRSSGRAR
jgi:plastocyanin